MIDYKKGGLIGINAIVPNKKQLSDELYIEDGELLHIKFTKIDGEWYLYKRVTNLELLNELIGSFLAKHIGLDTVEYIPGVDEYDQSVVLSKNFREFGFKYFMSDEIYKQAIPTFNSHIKKNNYSTECLTVKEKYTKQCVETMHFRYVYGTTR